MAKMALIQRSTKDYNEQARTCSLIISARAMLRLSIHVTALPTHAAILYPKA